jgi:hypothetical protein
VLKRDAAVDGEFTGWIPSLERVVLRKERFFETIAPATVQETLFIEPELKAQLSEVDPVTVAALPAIKDFKQDFYHALSQAGLDFTADALQGSEVRLEGSEVFIRAPKMMMLSLKIPNLQQIATQVAGKSVRIHIEADSTGHADADIRPVPGVSSSSPGENGGGGSKHGKKEGKGDNRAARPTLFGEKLQAVLELRK